MARRLARRLARGAPGVLCAAAVGLLALVAPAAAQQPTSRPTAPPVVTAPGVRRTRAAGDTIPRDSTGRRTGSGARDSTAERDTTKRELVKWAEGDSVLEALRARPGYTVTRYQGDRVTFDASRRTLRLAGEPAAVERGRTLLVGDTVIYNDSTQLIEARASHGDSIVLRDPDRGNDDVIAGRIEYDVATHRGVVRELSTSVESGERWFVSGDRAAIVSDTGSGGQRVYARHGTITSCDEAVPHYHFQAQELKVVGKNVLVARPAVLYIYDVPVMWLPFVFQDLRSGRRSGILSPRLGISELVRNSPTYRRHLENLGYYFALNDYMDASVALDWRSSSNATDVDPGWIRYSGEWRYRWLDRFVTGRLFLSQHNLSDPSGPQGDRSNTSLSWQHQQDFSARTHLSMNLNFETSTGVRQATALNPYTATATINSQANFQTERGPFSLSLGGSQTQYSGREDVTRNFPTLNVSAKPINLASWLLWTPTLSISNAQTINGQPLGAFAYRYRPGVNGAIDSAAVFRNTRNSSLQLGTPIRIFEFDWRNTVSVTEALNDFPDVRPIYGTVTTASGRDSAVVLENRVFARTFVTGVDWQTGIDLPQLLGGSWNITPRVDIVNVEGSAPLWLRTERTSNRFIRQGKRLQYGVSASPTIFGLFPGLGPVTRLRHSITSSLGYSYSPAAEVDSMFRNALNLNGSYLGGLAQSRVSLTLNQTLEAKLRQRSRDSSGTANTTGTQATGGADGEGRKIKLLTLNASSIEYDFIRADSLKRRSNLGWKSGFVTSRFNYGVRSDLVPGLNLDVGYSLFQGDVQSDTARFSPYRESVSMSFAVNRNSGIFAAINRVFGRAGGATSAPELDRNGPPTGPDTVARRVAAQPYAADAPFGRNQTTNFAGPPAGQGWQASFNFSSSRQRPVVGNNVVNLTGEQICAQLQQFDPIGYSQCLANPLTFQQRFGSGGLLPGVDPNGLTTTGGGQIFRTPAITTLQSNTSFAITPKWTAQWATTYDFRNRAFASHVVALQRELHDWNATFAFTQAPSGNFAFNFFIALKAQPEIKFNYDRQSIRDNRSGF